MEPEEQIDLDMNSSEARYSQRAEFAAVVFNNIPETYPDDAHIECCYTITPDLVPTSRDWVGVYKVAWMSPRDYVYYEWAPLPQDYGIGKEAEAHILFPAHKLPGDDGEFYQFCYVSSSGQIRGASTPFQFRRPSADDFVEENDEDSDMLVIRSKTVVLEENLHKKEAEKLQLIETQHTLEKERDGLVDKLCEMDRQLEMLQDENMLLQQNLHAAQDEMCQMNSEARDLTLVHDELNSRLETIQKEKEELAMRVDELESDIASLKAAMMTLQSEKDQLAGNNRSLEEEVQLYKNHFTTSESSLQAYVLQIDELRTKLQASESEVMSLKEQYCRLKQQLAEETTQMERQKLVTAEDQNHIQSLSEKLKNAEDKLGAAEEIKQILQEEITTYVETQQKISQDLEKSKSECYSLKQKVAKLDSEKEVLQADLTSMFEEKKAMDSELSSLNVELESTQMEKKRMEEEVTSGSMFALKKAQDTLKERYSKMKKCYTAKETEMSKIQKQAQQREQELTRELEDLRERVQMCSEEYKNLYIDHRKVQKKWEKANEKRKTKSVDRQSSQTLLMTVEKPLKAAATGGTTVIQKQPSRELSMDSLNVCELQKQLEDLGRELERRQEKKNKYKRLYNEEKERQETLRRHYHEDLKKRDEELERLKNMSEKSTSDHELKVKALEAFLTEKDRVAEELTQKLRQKDSTRLHDEPSQPRMAQKLGHQTPADKNYPFLMFGNPYDPRSYRCGVPAAIHYPPTAMYVPGYPVQQFPQSPPEAFQYTAPDETTEELSEDPLSDESGASENLAPPLTPLPAPLQPEVLPSAKLAAVRTHIYGIAPGEDEFDMTMIREDPVLPSAPPAVHMEDRFLDAVGEAMKICPVCDKGFEADMPDLEFQEHIISHVGRVCPICKKLVEDDVKELDYEYHVNQHLDLDQKEALGDSEDETA